MQHTSVFILCLCIYAVTLHELRRSVFMPPHGLRLCAFVHPARYAPLRHHAPAWGTPLRLHASAWNDLILLPPDAHHILNPRTLPALPCSIFQAVFASDFDLVSTLS